jgi:uncharacterized membrane protein YozB (DUF420 family)
VLRREIARNGGSFNCCPKERFMTDPYNLPGFLGTKAHFLSDLTLVLILFSSILFTIGWQLARHKHYKIHQWFQTTAVVINASVVLYVMIGSFWGYVLPAVPAQLSQPSVWITLIHAPIGLFTFLFGIFIVLRANNLVPRAFWFRNYKLVMRTAYALYILSALIGVLIYITTFILE